MESLIQRFEQSDRLAKITQQVGYALWQLQGLEDIAAQYFVLLTQATPGMGLEAGNVLIEKAKKKTFGTTLREITKAGLLNSELGNRITNLLSERNWLVHQSRNDNRNAIYNDLAARNLVARLDSIADESLALMKELGKLTESYVTKHGVSKEYINKTANQLLEQWRNSDSI